MSEQPSGGVSSPAKPASSASEPRQQLCNAATPSAVITIQVYPHEVKIDIRGEFDPIRTLPLIRMKLPVACRDYLFSKATKPNDFVFVPKNPGAATTAGVPVKPETQATSEEK